MKVLVFFLFVFTSIVCFSSVLGARNLEYITQKDNSWVPPHYIYDYFDTVSNEVNIIVFPLTEPGPPGGRFHFDICVFNADSLLMNGNVFISPIEIYTYLEDYYNYADTVSEGFPIHQFKTDAFGQNIPGIIFSVGINRFPTLCQWRTFFNLLDNIFELYDKKREILAQRFFETGFNVLTPEQKQIVIKHRPLDIRIFFGDCIYYNLNPVDN
jgi:hypothetical protein